MKPYIWVIIGLVAVSVALILLWPEPEPVDLDPYKRAIAIADIRIDSLTSANRKLASKIAQDSLQQAQEKKTYIVTIEKKVREIENLKANPVVVKIRETTPEVNALIIEMERMDSVKTERIATLENNLDGLRVDMRQMESNFGELLQSEREKFNAQKAISDELAKDLKKAKRSGRLAKILIPIAAVGAFLLGNGL
jgi:hypothetical protein